MKRIPCPGGLIALSLLAAVPSLAFAQDHSHHPPSETKPVADEKQDEHAAHAEHVSQKDSKPPQAESDDSTQAPTTPIPPLTDADRAAAFPPLQQHMQHAPEFNSFVQFNRLETWDAEHGRGIGWEGTAWFGSDLHRLWLRSEGERVVGRTEAADLEVLYGRSVSRWWDVLAGLKHDGGEGPDRTWAAVGVQGLAPQKFEVEITAYLGESGQTQLSLEAEYELLLSNRWVLQPLAEAELFGKDDPARGIGSGLSTVELGLRLRYEWHRQFAPYVGLVHERSFGGTADARRNAGEVTRDTRVVVGVRFWF